MSTQNLPIARSIALLFACSMIGCGHGQATEQHGQPPTAVSTAAVRRGTVTTYATFDGQVSPVYQTTLSTAEAGTVASVDATEGDSVRQGQVLATLDTSQLAAQLKANEATVRQDEAQLSHSDVAAPVAAQQYDSAVASARQNLQAAANSVRTARAALAQDALTEHADRELLAEQYVSKQTFEQAQAAYVAAQETLVGDEQSVTAQRAALETAFSNTNERGEDQATIRQNQAELDSAKANVELLRAEIAQSSIVAPFDGQVTQRLLDAGAYAGASTGIFELAQVSRVYVVANVPDVDLPAVDHHQAVSFATPSIPGRAFMGRVYDVNITPTSGTLSYRVRLLQPNPDLALRGGMLVTVNAVRGRHSNVLMVPSSALVTGTTDTSLFTIDRGKAKNVRVELGLQTDNTAEVRAPQLAPGTTVITSPPSGLQDGSPVTTGARR